MRPAFILAHLTVREALRRRILLAAFVLAAGFLSLYGLALHFEVAGWARQHHFNPLIRHEVLNAQAMLGLYAADLLTAMLAILAAIDTLSGEISSGTIHCIATRPVERWQIVLGKTLGLAAIVTGFLLFSALGVLAELRLLAHSSVRGVIPGLSLIWMEAMLLLSTTMLGGTLFSTLANGVVNLGLFLLAFLGGWTEKIGALTHNSAMVLTGITISLVMPSEALWSRAVYQMASPIARRIPFSPFSSISAPSGLMIVYAGLYLLAALSAALWRFQHRDL